MAPAVADLKAMTDAFEGIDKLAEGAPRTDGAPNFRRVNTNTDTNTNTNTKRRPSLDSRVTTPKLRFRGVGFGQQKSFPAQSLKTGKS